MKILVLNCGSSTLKFQLIEISESGGERKLARGIVDRIGADASYRFDAEGFSRVEASAPIHNHEAAVQLVIEWLRGIAQLRDIRRRRPSGGSWRRAVYRAGNDR